MSDTRLEVGKTYQVKVSDCCMSVEFTAKLLEKSGDDWETDCVFEHTATFANGIKLEYYTSARAEIKEVSSQ